MAASGDYAFAPYGKLGMTHRVSISYRGPTPESEEEEQQRRRRASTK